MAGQVIFIRDQHGGDRGLVLVLLVQELHRDIATEVLVMAPMDGPDPALTQDALHHVLEAIAGADDPARRRRGRLRAALERCKGLDVPAVIHVDVDPVKHMWAPALKEFKDMHAEPQG